MKGKGFLFTGLGLSALVVAFNYKRKPNMDKMVESALMKKNLEKIKLLHPAIRNKVIDFFNQAAKEGMNLILVSGLRDWKEQQALYDQGRTKPGKIVTNSKPGYSFHNFGLAFDVAGVKGKALDYNLDWKKLEKIGNSLGLVWGGNFKSLVDKPHWEFHGGYTLAQLRTLYNQGKIKNGYLQLT